MLVTVLVGTKETDHPSTMPMLILFSEPSFTAVLSVDFVSGITAPPCHSSSTPNPHEPQVNEEALEL